MNNIPYLPILRKMGIYSLNFNGVAIQAKVVDYDQLVADGIDELYSRVDSSFPFVGFDLKYTENKESAKAKVVVLHVKDRCLLVQLSRNRSIPISLSRFLSNRNICFMGVKMHEKLEMLGVCPMETTGADIGVFVARALNDPHLVGCVNLVELATKSGYLVQEKECKTTATQCPEPQWDAVCFSNEEVEYAVHEAYMCYSIATKLMTTRKGYGRAFFGAAPTPVIRS